jgi:hypothetical protein
MNELFIKSFQVGVDFIIKASHVAVSVPVGGGGGGRKKKNHCGF